MVYNNYASIRINALPDIGLRNLGTIIPGARGAEPAPAQGAARSVAKTAAAPAVAAEAAPPAAEAPIFAADVADDPAALASDALGLDAPLNLLAELASHRRTQTPLAIGLLGPSGCGKSVALNKLIHAIERLSAGAGRVGSTPFLAKILTLRVNAADLDGHPVPALASALYARLAIEAPNLAIEASQTARDPALAAREAFERLDAARRKLEAERRSLEEAETRRAKLAETVLYETPGSQVDAYASRRRNRIAATMARFGVAGDPLLGYKDMVRALADSQGVSRTGFALQAFWGLKGQSKLIVTAIVFALIGFGLGLAFDNQSTWIGWLRTQPQMAGATDWIEAHVGWLLTLRGAAFVAAALALLTNIWRGLRLIQLVFRGESLLKGDLFERRRESDAFFGHQTRRVQDFAAEVDRLSRHAAEAERRAGGLHSANPALAEPSPFQTDVLKQQAQRFIAAVGALVQKRGAAQGRSAETPQRIVVALDNLDLLPTSRARDILVHVRNLLGPGYVSLISTDPLRFGAGSPDDALDLDKWIQAPFQVGEISARQDYSAQIRAIIGGAAPDARESKQPATLPDAARSVLDEPLTDDEAQLLTALAPLAGPSARAVKRFVNLYRLLRGEWRDRPEERGALAFMLALDAGGSPSDVEAVKTALLAPGGDAAFDHYKVGPRLASALLALGSAQGRPSIDALRRAAAAVRAFSFHPADRTEASRSLQASWSDQS
ncbi:conserved hypothetical protein [Methylocella tundrae]|uniref:KAP NTPase domain-containing protein n=1 Tax=Methylocella tundrae TaxID=227605 RepID=A0A8B6M2L3_METTU|nr:conserved hypothetical protein [Methylocella tundrae]